MKIFAQITFFLVLTYCNGSNEKGGFIFTAPKTLLSGSDERVCITFKKITEPVRVQVVLLQQKNDREIASASELFQTHENGGKCFALSVPRTKSNRGRLNLSISFTTLEDYSINYTEQIFIQPSPDVVYILTDKPIYSGGQVVKFRIFILRYDMMPVEENVERIWIENPNGVHLAQWLNESTSNGFIDKSFELSGEPLTGHWKIYVKRKFDGITSQGFNVEDYVLPRFTVSVDAPKSVNFTSNFSVTVCAKYIFGEPVRGNVSLHVHIKCSFAFYCRSNNTSQKVYLKLSKNGCVSHTFRISDISNFYQKIVVNATVRETGTDIEATETNYVDIKTEIKGNGLEFSSHTKEKLFKPGLPFKGQVIQKNFLPTTESDVTLCLDVSGTKQCSRIHFKDGLADFILAPTGICDNENFSVSLSLSDLKNHKENGINTTILHLVPWYSPSGSYLQLEDLSNGVLKCNRNTTINVVYSTPNPIEIPQFYFLVKSRGNIIKNGLLTPNQGDIDHFNADGKNVLGNGNFSLIRQFQFSLNITSIFSPISYLLVYYIQPDGEIVADTLSLNVVKCLKTPVSMQWDKNISLPGDVNRLEVKTVPNSVCALSVTDRSMKFLSKATEFSKDIVFKSFKKFNADFRPSTNPTRRIQNASTNPSETEDMDYFTNYPETDSRFVDSLQAFEDFGVILISDLIVETRPLKRNWKLEKSMKNIVTRQSSIREYGKEPENLILPKRSNIIKMLSKQKDAMFGFELRNFFPETWIWDVVNINSSGRIEMDVIMPHTITEWDSEAICLSKETGLGIAEIKRMITYQPFFLDFAVPQSMKRKEILHLSVSVFNYEEEDLPIKITYIPSSKFVARGDSSASYCVKSKSKVVHKFILEPLILGEAIVAVMAEIDLTFDGNCGHHTRNMRDTVSKKTLIKHEGFPIAEVKSGFICANNKNFEDEITWSIKIPADIVESSISVNALVCGDILGPSLQNIEKVITLPTGCGEQNMILLAPNILILQYLLLTKSEDSELLEKTLKNLDLGYQKQLNFRRDDGSYSAFGKKDEKGSIWLTAFVVRYLSQAQKFIHVDKNDLNVTVQWILKHQLENGCFPVIGKIYHRDLKGKFMENDSSKALTAYIIISLIESGMVTESTSAMKNAVYCLRGIEQSTGTFGDLLTTYALLMVEEVREAQSLMFELLKSASRAYGLLWWENDENSSVESSVETTAYGILCLLKLGGSYFMAAASDAVKWITRYRNQNGGFISSQDTILALEAISKFSASLPRMSDTDKLVINLEAMKYNYSFIVEKNNLLLQQKRTLSAHLTGVKFVASGEGCALVQTCLKYNIRHGVQNNQLKIQVKIDSVSDIDRYFVTKFSICVRHKSNDPIKMAVLEVFMVSGFYPDRTSLYDIPISQKGVRKWEEFEERIVFYFEDLKQKKVCVQFLVNQEACIEKSSPALIKLYDYYNNHNAMSVKYSLQPECHNNTNNWLNGLPSDQKLEKRDTSKDIYWSHLSLYNSENLNYNLDNFVDVSYDLETPEENGPLPLIVPYQSNGTAEHDCPQCVASIPDIFPSLYCSAKNVIEVSVHSKDFVDIITDLTPRTDFKFGQKRVAFSIKKECCCDFLNNVKVKALILVAPPMTLKTDIEEFHFDSSITIIQLQGDELHEHLKEAIRYCRKWDDKHIE